MRALILLLLASPALADETAFSGTYGSATDAETSCAVNPHNLSFASPPPHAFLEWERPYVDASGQQVMLRRFDLEAMTGNMLTLREEGGLRLADGSRPVWLLRLTENPKGYCWGRADWPLVRCEDQQLLCNVPIS